MYTSIIGLINLFLHIAFEVERIDYLVKLYSSLPARKTECAVLYGGLICVLLQFPNRAALFLESKNRTWTCYLMVSSRTAFSSLLAFISSVSSTSVSSFLRSLAASSVNLSCRNIYLYIRMMFRCIYCIFLVACFQ